MEESDLFVEDLGQDIDTNILFARLSELDVSLAEGLILSLEQHDLGQNLVGEGARHDEGGVTGGASQVDETTLGEENDVAAAGHGVSINLRLDVLNAPGGFLEPSNINFYIKVADLGFLLALSRTEKERRELALHTIASFRIASKCFPTMISRQPVVVTKIWP
jgi:hypothetical protein